MAIIFEHIKWKNFLSTGDSYTEVNLNPGASTLIIGANGSGKSTLLDALSFALFGKPHREINKPQLVNSINGKNCEVQVEFRVGKTKLKIIRGIKPSVFEIWQNGVLINQEAHSLDYQKVLEQNILKLNHKSFHQIVVLGSSSFVPFMQLQTNHRREVIEDLLDINIFAKMNNILKEKNAKLRDQLTATTFSADLNANTTAIHKKYIADLKSRGEEQIARNLAKISVYQTEIDSLMVENALKQDTLNLEHESIKKTDASLAAKRLKMLTFAAQISANISSTAKSMRFYSENDSCPTCSQHIQSEFKTDKIHKCGEKNTELSSGRDLLNIELATLDKQLALVRASLLDYSTIEKKIWHNNSTISRLQGSIRDLEKENLAPSDKNLTEAEHKLLDLDAERDSLAKLKTSHYEEGAYNQAISEMLKDTGIKTKVIKQYLPVMNKLINSYLQTLDFFVAFHLSEAFEETIKSRHRDEFSYASFSEGEKQRIDLALLFTWRQIARMKNSISTNLLILDETFDSSMDTDGVDNLLKILQTLDAGTAVFVISHKPELIESKFTHKLEFSKPNNFSVLQKK